MNTWLVQNESEKVSHACINSLPSYLQLHPLKQDKRVREKQTFRERLEFQPQGAILSHPYITHVHVCLHKAAPWASDPLSSSAPSWWNLSGAPWAPPSPPPASPSPAPPPEPELLLWLLLEPEPWSPPAFTRAHRPCQNHHRTATLMLFFWWIKNADKRNFKH